MKPTLYLQNILRFVVIIILQVLVFKGVTLNWGILQHVHFIIYPLFILLAPLNMPRSLLIILSFAMGLTIDSFYDSVGVHASACVFTAYIRSIVLKMVEPFEGYSIGISPSRNNLGFTWFMSYSSILLFLHCLFYFSVEAFSFVYYIDIAMRTLFSFLFSMSLIMIHQLIFNTA